MSLHCKCGTLRGRLGETVEILESRSVDICCVQETRFRVKSFRMISGKDTEQAFLDRK